MPCQATDITNDSHVRFLHIQPRLRFTNTATTIPQNANLFLNIDMGHVCIYIQKWRRLVQARVAPYPQPLDQAVKKLFWRGPIWKKVFCPSLNTHIFSCPSPGNCVQNPLLLNSLLDSFIFLSTIFISESNIFATFCLRCQSVDVFLGV